MGFDYFYGFMGAETDQWTRPVPRSHPDFPVGLEPGFKPHHDMADERSRM